MHIISSRNGGNLGAESSRAGFPARHTNAIVTGQALSLKKSMICMAGDFSAYRTRSAALRSRKGMRVPESESA
ncbi:hypothetical protein L1787_05885 [Acuticoccus sp. M5D2P5]|uniref:hypothetical protein n=1 Tax=Acuticoccus kalidii TaxID=2910977 RepID=UPI001F3B6DF6|nr:hypothetical protein [Acuticoccus kalidii]MCF3932944.1 hypothetical protein [Acuticoccus kalidii]